MNDQFERESNQSKVNEVIKKPSMPVVTTLEDKPAPVKRRVENHKTEPIQRRVSSSQKGLQTPIQELDDDKLIKEVEEEESVKKPSKKKVLSNQTLRDEDAEADISVKKLSQPIIESEINVKPFEIHLKSEVKEDSSQNDKEDIGLGA